MGVSRRGRLRATGAAPRTPPFEGGVRIERMKPGSPGIAKGVPPLSVVLDVNGEPVVGLSVDAAAVFLFMKRASYDSGLDILLRAIT